MRQGLSLLKDTRCLQSLLGLAEACKTEIKMLDTDAFKNTSGTNMASVSTVQNVETSSEHLGLASCALGTLQERQESLREISREVKAGRHTPEKQHTSVAITTDCNQHENC